LPIMTHWKKLGTDKNRIECVLVEYS